ncbi:MAG: helix-turn-helix transcriptional regulator [Clostridia bacterium]|nr:helix-turn-helix transcriptional regulator [Clostridia bacterium]
MKYSYIKDGKQINYLTEQDITGSPYSRIVVRNDCPLHTHAFFEFTICLSGVYNNYINGVCHTIEHGRIILLRPMDEHYFLADVPHTSRDIYVTVDVMKNICDSLSPTLFDKLLNQPLALDFSIPDFEMQMLESKMSYLNVTDGKSDLQLKARHRNVVTSILDLWLSNINDTVDTPQWLSLLVSRLSTASFINKNIEEIIASTNYSHGYVCREFKRFMGKTLQDYLAETRFSYAISLLANNENSVAQVAEKLGYNATSNFIIAFRNKYGVTPAQWRKEKT